MKALFKVFGRDGHAGLKLVGAKAVRASKDRGFFGQFPGLIPYTAVALEAFAMLTASAHIANAETHPTNHTPEQAFETGVRCAAGAAALVARLPANDRSQRKQRALEMVAKERSLAITEGAKLSISETGVEQRIQETQAKITLAANRPDHGAKPSDGKINQRIFYPLLDCELSQIDEEITAKKAEQSSKSGGH